MKNQKSQTTSDEQESGHEIIELWTIYDTKMRTYSDLICCTEKELERYCDVIVNSHSEMPHHKNPEDFVIYAMGVFDKDTGKALLEDDKIIFQSLAAYRKTCKFCNKETN